jgi:amphi-Trp domain-containing protein
MASINEFKHETLQDNQAIIDYLKVLTEGFESGELVFRNEKEQILLQPHSMIQLEVKAKKKDRKVKMSLKMSWTEEISAEEDNHKLIIDSKL